MSNICNISFMAKPGPEIMRRVTAEYNGNETRVTKFRKLFEDTFIKNLDENTVVDINNQEQYIFSHLKFPNIVYTSDMQLDRGRGNNFSSSIIMACPTVLSSVEHKMIRTIIANYVKSGTSLEDINKMVEMSIKNEKVKNYFLDNLNIASRIIEMDPNSNLMLSEFDEMEMVIFNERAEISGTPEYESVYGAQTDTS